MPNGVRARVVNDSGPWHVDESRFSLIRDKHNRAVCWMEGGFVTNRANAPLVLHSIELAKTSQNLLDACDNLAIYGGRTVDRQTLSDLEECVGRARAEVRAVLDKIGVIVL